MMMDPTSKKTVYLNNAATTYPKPETVLRMAEEALANPPQSQYRSSAADTLPYEKLCRRNLARLFGIPGPDRIFLTSGATQALNMAVLGVFRQPDRKRHGLVITQTEHNSVLRTVYDGLAEELSGGRVHVTCVACDANGHVDPEDMRRAVTEDTALVVLNHCSNVTGALQDARAIGKIAHEKGALFLLDVSQSAGCLPVSANELETDLLAFTGHKALFGMQGTGGLYIREGLTLRPVLFGGTGTDSAVLVPEKPFYEVGTANGPGIASLYAGTEYLLNLGIEEVMRQEQRLMKVLYEGLKDIPMVRVYSDRLPEGPLLSFRVRGLRPSDVGYILSGTYQISVRTGLHCSPLIHKALGTEDGGTVRVSISYLTKETDAEYFIGAVREIAAGL